MDWRDLVSRQTLQITPGCQLRCLGCELWGTHPFDPDFPELIPVSDWGSSQNSPFSMAVPRTHRVNLVGGDPLLVPDLPQLLRHFEAQQVSVRIWTPLLREVPNEVVRTLHRSGSGLAVVLPAPDPDMYRQQSGWDGLSRVTENLRAMIGEGIPCVVVAHVTPTLVEWLPYWHDFARSMGVPLWVTYYIFDGFSNDERAHIHRYNWVMDTVVFPLAKRRKQRCMAVPDFALTQDRAVTWVWIKQWVDRFRQWLGL